MLQASTLVHWQTLVRPGQPCPPWPTMGEPRFQASNSTLAKVGPPWSARPALSEPKFQAYTGMFWPAHSPSMARACRGQQSPLWPAMIEPADFGNVWHCLPQVTLTRNQAKKLNLPQILQLSPKDNFGQKPTKNSRFSEISDTVSQGNCGLLAGNQQNNKMFTVFGTVCRK